MRFAKQTFHLIPRINFDRCRLWSRTTQKARIRQRYLELLRYETQGKTEADMTPEKVADIKAEIRKTIKWERRKDITLTCVLTILVVIFLAYFIYRFIDMLVVNKWVA